MIMVHFVSDGKKPRSALIRRVSKHAFKSGVATFISCSHHLSSLHLISNAELLLARLRAMSPALSGCGMFELG